MQMKLKILFSMLIALLVADSVLAGGPDEAEVDQQVEYQAILEEAERARMEAEAARKEAIKVAGSAREAARREALMEREEARMEAELAHSDSAAARERVEKRARERALQQEEMARAREELSKAHRELKEASREVARAHRELDTVHRVHKTLRVVNLGDRAVIGLVLGNDTPDGVEVIGVSPDGPAERAGLKQGDVLVSIRGENLAGDGSARDSVYRIMDEVEDGEELAVGVQRDGEPWEFTVTAERREPSSWQSMIHIPDIEVISHVEGDPSIIVERIEVPEIDHEALEAQMAELAEKLKEKELMFAHRYGDLDAELEGFEFEEYSDIADHAMREANLWFGLPQAHGLEFAAINESLGAYFKTDRGVLVLEARADNAYQLEAGDVILNVGSTPVNSPGDMIRALRELEPGSEITLEIKRERRDKTLKVVMPESRLGFR